MSRGNAPREPDVDPFSNLSTQPLLLQKPAKLSRRVIIRRTVACFLFLIGVVVAAWGAILIANEAGKLVSRITLFSGLGLIALSFTIYDGRWTYKLEETIAEVARALLHIIFGK
jgi:hypothetical protein